MKQLLPLFLIFSSLAIASDEFGAESPIENSEKIPSPVISYLSKEINLGTQGCQEEKLSDALEAKLVRISAHTKALVVKPKAWCLCSAYYCPMWLFQIKENTANQIWSTEGTGGFEILDKKTKGYRQIKASGGVAGHGSESIWAWNGKQYEETYRQVWTWNNEKACREAETFHLKHGRLEKAPDSCIAD